MRPRKRDPDRPVTGEEVEASLARKIHMWAETWQRCPRKGCRRAGECLSFDDCAGVPKEPVVFTEAEQRAFRKALDKALGRQRGGHAGGYDPDQRERDRPMPPAPKRIAPSSRPGEAEPPAPDPDPGSPSRDPET